MGDIWGTWHLRGPCTDKTTGPQLLGLQPRALSKPPSEPVSHYKPQAWVWNRLPGESHSRPHPAQAGHRGAGGGLAEGHPWGLWTQGRVVREPGLGESLPTFSLQAWAGPSWVWGPVGETHTCGPSVAHAGAAASSWPQGSLASLDLQWKLTNL